MPSNKGECGFNAYSVVDFSGAIGEQV